MGKFIMGKLCLPTLPTHTCIVFSWKTGVQNLKSDYSFILALYNIYLLISLVVSKQVLVYLMCTFFQNRHVSLYKSSLIHSLVSAWREVKMAFTFSTHQGKGRNACIQYWNKGTIHHTLKVLRITISETWLSQAWDKATQDYLPCSPGKMSITSCLRNNVEKVISYESILHIKHLNICHHIV